LPLHEHQVENADDAAVDQVDQDREALPGQSAPWKLDDQVVDGTNAVNVSHANPRPAGPLAGRQPAATQSPQPPSPTNLRRIRPVSTANNKDHGHPARDRAGCRAMSRASGGVLELGPDLADRELRAVHVDVRGPVPDRGHDLVELTRGDALAGRAD